MSVIVCKPIICIDINQVSVVTLRLFLLSSLSKRSNLYIEPKKQIALVLRVEQFARPAKHAC